MPRAFPATRTAYRTIAAAPNTARANVPRGIQHSKVTLRPNRPLHYCSNMLDIPYMSFVISWIASTT